MESNYVKVFGGNTIKANRVKTALKENQIKPIVKDERESARLAGFGTPQAEHIEIFVHTNQEEKALALIAALDW